MTHLSLDDIHELHERLTEERASLIEALGEHGKRVGGNWQGTPEGFSEQDTEVNDAADRMEELSTNVPLVEELERRLADVEHALEKMRTNTYGHDEVSGTPIPLERLRANPAARNTVGA